MSDTATVAAVIAAIGQLIERIPATFWGVVIGSTIALGGVILTNRAQAHRQRLDLEHDRAERKKDREFAARKEVFIAAAGGLYGMTQAIAKIGNLDFPYTQITAESTEHSAPVARTYLIADDQTVRAIAKLSSGVQASFLKLSPLRHQLDAAKRRLAELEAKQQRHNEAGNRVVELMRQMNLGGGLNKRRVDVANAILEYEQKAAMEAAKERDRLNLEAYPKQLELAEAAVAATRELWPDIVAALAAIRGELGLPTDQAMLLDIIRDAARRPLEEFDKLMRRLREEAAEHAKRAKDG